MLGGVSPIELNGMVTRTQDFSAVKQHEDMKSVVDQNNSQAQVDRNVEHDAHSVTQGQKAQTEGDNAGGGLGSYFGDGGRNRKKKEEDSSNGKVVLKKRGGGFDFSV